MAFLNHSIEPIQVYIRKSDLYRKPKKVGFESGKIIAIQSYKGFSLSFKILLDNGSVWDFILPNICFTKKITDEEIYSLSLNDLVYNNCPSNKITVYKDKELLKHKCIDVWFKNKKTWHIGKYLLTVDWYTDNNSFNLIELSTGHLACVPNHKMLVRINNKVPKKLPKYRALKYIGKV